MNSFQRYIIPRILVLVTLVAVAVGTVHSLDTAEKRVEDTRTAHQIALDTSWDAVVQEARESAPSKHVTLEVLTTSGTPAVYSMPECAEEDSHNCIWLADKRGNGFGKSFADLGGIVYWERSY